MSQNTVKSSAPETQAPVEPHTYQGSCHCGAVRFEVELAIDKVLACNCSICLRTGALLTFTTPDKFKLLSGEDALTDYQFNKKVIHHLFCSTCGIRSFARGTTQTGAPMYAINVRCLEGVDPAQLHIQPVDGKNF